MADRRHRGADQLRKGCLLGRREGGVAPQLFLVVISHYVDIHRITGDQTKSAGFQELDL